MIREKNTFISYFIPTYDEVTLFAIGLTCGLLLIAGGFTINWVESGWSEVFRSVGAMLFIGMFLAGLLLSLYHALTDRPKKEFEKTLMLLFAVILNALSGIMAGGYVLENTEGWHWPAIFPMMNIVSGMLLLGWLKDGTINADNISDKNASGFQVALTGAAIIILFIVCHYKLDLLWPQTLSICVAYSTNLNRSVQAVFVRLT